MKKIMLILLIMMTAIMCGVEKVEKEKNATESSEGKLPKKFIVGLDDTFAPMGFRNEKGELVGFDIDLARFVAQKMGSEVEFKPINWDSKIMDLNSGNIDLIWNGLTITPERSEQTEMSKPYFKSDQVIITRTDTNIIKKDDLKGKIVGVQSQSSGEEKVKKLGEDKNFKEFKGYAQYDQAFLDLDAKRIDAIVIDELFAKYIKNIKETQSNKQLYVILEENYGEEEMGIAGKKGNKVLIDAINSIIEESKTSGEYDKIYKKWFKD